MSFNPFLDRFMKQQVIQTTVPQQQEPAKRDHKGRKKSKYGTSHGGHPFGGKMLSRDSVRRNPIVAKY
jgi:hypothetical protein